MKTIGIILTLLILSCDFAYTQEFRTLEPIKEKEPVILISGRNISYYKLKKRKFVNFPVEGAYKIMIYSRKRIDKRDKPRKYTISYKFDNLLEKNYTSDKVNIDNSTVYTDKFLNKNPSEFFRESIKVPKNAKKIELMLLDSNDDVDVSIIAYYKTGKKKKIRPVNYTEKNIIKTGRKLKYYKLNSVIPTIIKLKNPGELFVYTRERLSADNETGYNFSYKDKNANKKIIHIPYSRISSKTLYKSYDIYKKPSGFHKTVIDIPPNYGELQFSSVYNADARFVFKEAKTKPDWKKISPLNKCEKVELQYKKTKTIRNYNRISGTKKFSFNTNDDSRIRIFTRGEFTYDMHSNNDYEIILKEGDKIINTYKLSCFRSSQTEYNNNDEMIPGTLDRVYIDIPQGKHSYTLSVNNNNKTALIRVYVSKN